MTMTAPELPNKRWWANPEGVFVDLVEERGTTYTPSTVDRRDYKWFDLVGERPAWHALAACRGQMTEGGGPWFSKSVHVRREARLICEGCPVRAECHDAGDGQFGVWG